MNIAAKVAAAKKRWPEDFCEVKGCLWRIFTARGVSPCRNHPSGAERVVPTVSCPTVEQTTALRADVVGIGPTVALPPSRLHNADCLCKHCTTPMPF